MLLSTGCFSFFLLNRVIVDLMREMQDIESQRSAIPPVPASKVKDQLNNDSWALQYLEDGKNFTVRFCFSQLFLIRD